MNTLENSNQKHPPLIGLRTYSWRQYTGREFLALGCLMVVGFFIRCLFDSEYQFLDLFYGKKLFIERLYLIVIFGLGFYWFFGCRHHYYVLNPQGIYLECNGKIKSFRPWSSIKLIVVRAPRRNDPLYFRLRLLDVSHTCVGYWKFHQRTKLFKVWKVLLACHPDLVHQLSEKPQLHRIEHQFIRESLAYLNSSDYRSFEQLELDDIFY